MRRLWIVALVVIAALPLLSQVPAGKWTVGTVMAVTPHVATASDDPSSAPRFDVTVRVARIDYVVLYTEPTGIAGVEYSVGRDAPVLVGSKILSFRSKVGEKVDMPILSRKPAGSGQKNR